MKTFLTFCTVLLLSFSSRASITVTNMVTYGASGGASTNYGVPVLIGNAFILIPPDINISHAALVTTNSAVVTVQVGTSTASNLMSTVTTFYPQTNAMEEVIHPASLSIPIYEQTVVVTTNNSTIGTKAIFNNP